MRNRSFFLSFIFCMFLNVHYIESCFAQAQDNSSPGSVELEKKRDLNSFIGACFLSLIFLNHADISYKGQESFNLQFRPENLLCNLASTYFMNFICNFCHELGHGLTKKILCGCDFTIHLGCSPDDKNQAIIDSRYVSLEGLDPLAGFNSHECSSVHNFNKSQKILINLSGGMAGMLANCALKFLYNLLTKETLQESFVSAISIDQIMVTQMLNVILPMQYDSKVQNDAVKIWRACGVGEDKLKFFSEISPCLAMLAFIALSFKQAKSDLLDENLLTNKIFIGLANYFLQGFLQFKSA